jgi:hypothetical protein
MCDILLAMLMNRPAAAPRMRRIAASDRIRSAATTLWMLLACITAAGAQPPSDTAPAFRSADLRHGFFRLAFGSDMQTFNEPTPRLHKFDRPVGVFISADPPDNPAAKVYRWAINDFIRQMPELHARIIDETDAPDILVRLVPPEKFKEVLIASLGEALARPFIRLTNPRCTTRLRIRDDGVIMRADIFIPASRDLGDILDCAYHESLHAFGLMNHADDLRWTSLNQTRRASALTGYDKALLQILYDPHLTAGMTADDVEKLWPRVVKRRD